MRVTTRQMWTAMQQASSLRRCDRLKGRLRLHWYLFVIRPPWKYEAKDKRS